MVPKSWWLTGLAGLAIVAALPFVGHWLRGDQEERCAWDGQELEPIYQVRIVEEPAIATKFCCIRCAESWLERRGRQPLQIFVTDEASGTEIESSKAHYVRSTVATNAVTGNRRHAFAAVEDAVKHAEGARGRQLSGADRPFTKPTEIGNPENVR